MKKMIWGEDPEFSGPRNWYRESLIINEILKHKKKGKILDFGCGSGNTLLRFLKKGFQGIGIDVSKPAIKFFEKIIKNNNFQKNAKLEIGNEELLFSKKYRNYFDIIICGETLEHIKDDKNIVKGFFEVLKKGGICAISVPAHMNQWDTNDDFSSHFRRYEKNELIKLFMETGFSIKKVYYWGYPLSFFWHRLIYLRLVNKKITKEKNYSNAPGLFGSILSNSSIKRILSFPFWFDNLFNWTKLGGGLILVAEKANE